MIKDYILDKNPEKKIQKVINSIHENGPISDIDFEFLAYMKKYHNKCFIKYEKDLLYAMGLFYKTEDPDSLLSVFYNTFLEDIKENTSEKYTPMQSDVYDSIHENKYFSFSAPTSSGKSFLFMNILKEIDGNVIIVVPSRALIAEYIKKLQDLFKEDKNVLVIPFIDLINVKHSSKTIFVVTPERGEEIFKYYKKLDVSLFLFDEAQITDYVRSIKFEHFIRRVEILYPNAKKVFTHPFVENPEAQLKKHNFVDSASSCNYNYRAVGKFYLTYSNGNFNYFSPFYKGEKNSYKTTDIIKETLENDGTLLVYISKASIYKNKHLTEEPFKSYLHMCNKIIDSKAIEIIDKLKLFLGITKKGQSIFIDMMERGIVIHHGSMPLKARYLVESFISEGFAKVCFATSTLLQGINMPFDVIWIYTFAFYGGGRDELTNELDKSLALKNLIGRAGRTSKKSELDLGSVIINSSNKKKFIDRIRSQSIIPEESILDINIDSIEDEDSKDIVEAIQNNENFDTDLLLTESQIERINNKNILGDIQFILANLMNGANLIEAKDYNVLKKSIKDKLKLSLINIYVAHLRRDEITPAEKGVLSTALLIMLWKIQGKSFKNIVGFRYSYLTRRDERRALDKEYELGNINFNEYKEQKMSLKVRYSQIMSTLPNPKLSQASEFNKLSAYDLEYDRLIYDTYDYLDKVISLSISKPITAAFKLYYDKTNDVKALTFINYVKYGTNNSKEIMLLRYGFDFEDIDWISEHVEYISVDEIVFHNSINELDSDKYEIIERYVYE
jgi:hypothetical protein